MKQITVGTGPKQKIIILFEDTTIELTLKFRPTIECWTIDIVFRDGPLVNGFRLVPGSPLLKQFNKPFDIVLKENEKTDIEPFKQDDFTSRISMFLLEREDVKELRGYDVI